MVDCLNIVSTWRGGSFVPHSKPVHRMSHNCARRKTALGMVWLNNTCSWERWRDRIYNNCFRRSSLQTMTSDLQPRCGPSRELFFIIVLTLKPFLNMKKLLQNLLKVSAFYRPGYRCASRVLRDMILVFPMTAMTFMDDEMRRSNRWRQNCVLFPFLSLY